MVADVFETWMNEADIDGFNVMRLLFLFVMTTAWLTLYRILITGQLRGRR